MAAYLKDTTQIAFDFPPGEGDWVRADRYDNGVGFDAVGLCLLDADECRELAAWLIEAAALLPPKQESIPIKRRPGRMPGRHNQAA